MPTDTKDTPTDFDFLTYIDEYGDVRYVVNGAIAV